MNDFKFDSLRNLTSKIGSGATPEGGQSNYKSDGISLIRSQNVLDMRFSKVGLAFIDTVQASKLNNVKVEQDDILLNITGDSIARVCKVPAEILPARVNQHVSIIRSNGKIHPDYLLYYLIFRKNHLLTISRVGGTRNALTKEAVEKIQIRLDKNSEQIAKVLSFLDSKIELNNKINDNLEQMAKAIFDYWFVQYDFPNEEGKPYKSSGGKMIYSEVLKRSVPIGWKVAELRDYLTTNRGVSYSGKEIIDAGVPMINLNSFNIDGTFKIQGTKSFSGIYSSSKILKPYDLVMCNTQQTALDPQKDIIGKTFLVPDIFKTEIISSHHVTTINVNEKDLKFYLYKLFNTEYFHRYISGYSTGTSILGLNIEGVLSYWTEIPNNELLSRFKDIVINVEKQKNRIIKENQQLTELRDWLLPMLMNGQITVK